MRQSSRPRKVMHGVGPSLFDSSSGFLHVALMIAKLLLQWGESGGPTVM